MVLEPIHYLAIGALAVLVLAWKLGYLKTPSTGSVLSPANPLVGVSQPQAASPATSHDVLLELLKESLKKPAQPSAAPAVVSVDGQPSTVHETPMTFTVRTQLVPQPQASPAPAPKA